MKAFGERLRVERTRLGFSQEDFGRAGGVSRNSQGDYEKGKTSCTIEYLFALVQIGVDSSFVFSGSRSAGALTPEQSEWLACFDLLDDEQRSAVLNMVQVMIGRRRTPATIHTPVAQYKAR